MKRSESKDQIHRVYAYDATIFEKLSQNSERDPIIGIIKSGDDDRGVRNVEIRVTRWQTFTVEIEWGGHRQRDHFGARAVLQAKLLNPIPVLGEGMEIDVFAVRFL